MWSAIIWYDEGRLGSIGCHGLKSREDAILWLNKVYSWDRCYYKWPSWEIKETASLNRR